jgi:hypothetical protein
MKKIAIVATSLLLATAIPATAGHYGGGGDPNWGAVAGAGILGALLGAAAAPQPQAQQTIIVTPSPASPTIYLWCAPLARFYGQIATCPAQWQPVQVQR